MTFEGRPLGPIFVPAGLEVQVIEIPVENGRCEIEALTRHHLALYRDLDELSSGWTIAHIATGHALVMGIDFAAAAGYLSRLDEAIDWTAIRIERGVLTGWGDEERVKAARVLGPIRPEFAKYCQ